MDAEFGQLFTFKNWHFEATDGRLQLFYHDDRFGDFGETFQFKPITQQRYNDIKPALVTAIQCLHWMAGVSYYKTSLAQAFLFEGQQPNDDQAKWLTDTWQSGLAELAHENNLGWLEHIVFNGRKNTASEPKPTNLSPRSLVAIGGGKDSLVAIESLKAQGEDSTLFMVGQAPLIQAVAAQTQLSIEQVLRQVDPKLTQVNQQGAYNGHVPITAINACVAVVAALLYDYDSVVFANERSAESGNVQAKTGQWVNHQHSKSLAYERQWQTIITRHISQDLCCFSLLRPFSELAIVKKFTQWPKYFSHFSSCNRNFHLAGSRNKTRLWCGACPKCAFVFLCLAPFVTREQLLAIFQQDLFADDSMSSLFEALMGLQGNKPFECVGEAAECRLALQLLAQQDSWSNHPKVKQWLTLVPETSHAEAAGIMRAGEAHQIPDRRKFRQVLADVD